MKKIRDIPFPTVGGSYTSQDGALTRDDVLVNDDPSLPAGEPIESSAKPVVVTQVVEGGPGIATPVIPAESAARRGPKKTR